MAVDGKPEEFRSGWIYIGRGKVEALGDGKPPDGLVKENKSGPIRIIDAKGDLVLPSFTNAHTHLAQSFSRVLSTEPRLNDWLLSLRPMRKAMSADDVYLATCLGLIENLRCGVGAVVDNFKHTNSSEHFTRALSAAESLGMRVLVVRGFRDRDPSGPDGWAGLIHDLSIAERYLSRHHGKVSLGIGPTTLQNCAPETVRISASEAKKLGVPYHLHIAETSEEIENWLARTGMRPVEWMSRNNLLGKASHLVHCVHVNDDEIAEIARTKALVIHCPVSNLLLQCGNAPTASFLHYGVRLAVATDGQGSNGSQDIFGSLKLAALLGAKVGEGITYDPLTYLRMALQPVFQSESDSPRIGLAIEKPGDVVILSTRTPHTIPTFTPAGAIIYSMNSTNVRSVIVGGEVLLDEGRVTVINESELLEECVKALGRLGTVLTSDRVLS